MLEVAHRYVCEHAPELADAKIVLHMLDGPAEAPRYAVSIYTCLRTGPCPHHVSVADQERCPVLDCVERQALRLLLSREGEVIEVIRDSIRWDQ